MNDWQRKSPLDWEKYVNKMVKVAAIEKHEYEGWVLTVDPVSASVVLATFLENEKVSISVVLGHAVQEVEILKEGGDEMKQRLSCIFAPEESKAYSPEELEKRKNDLKTWLETNHIPVTEQETKVYVGNLGTGAGKGELERAFSYYGPLRTVWIARNPPGFAFVEFEDPRDAEDAVLGLDGKIICGSRVRVEVSTGMPRRSRYDRPPARRPFDPNDRCYECGEKGHYAYDCHRYSRRRRSRFLRLSQSP
uniref:Gem-associated protein 6 n=1 Tax=Bubo bubo TaxID=30461 RepID=A0A8C0FGR7_BUBBB